MRSGPKEWSPKNPFPPEKIIATLKKLAPSVKFSVDWERDENHVWDGDGPDPMEEDFEAYNVRVSVMAIVEGDLLEVTENIGGVYDKPGEEDPDIHGYLPQMLGEAARRLMRREMPNTILSQLKAASEYIDEVLRIRYDRHHRGR